jgi:hypothetical protein
MLSFQEKYTCSRVSGFAIVSIIPQIILYFQT